MTKIRLQKLQRGVQQLDLKLSEQVQQQLLDYLDHLSKWNKAYNLTAITDPMQMVSHHLLDSLAIMPFIQGNNILDVGTGAGLPGLVLAIVMPDKQFTLLDSNGKKIRFLIQTIASMGLKNVQAIQSRVESYQVDEKFDVIIARAVASTQQLVDNSRALLCNKGQFILMKGKHPAHELQSLSLPYQVQSIEVPGVDAPRHVVIIEQGDLK